jgi:hypothetical protein
MQKGAETGQTRQIRQIRDVDDRTMQLDSLGPEFARRGRPEPVLPELSVEGGDGPVFVDESGRRGKKFRRLGWVLGAICAVYAVMLVASLIGGNSFAPGLLIPGEKSEEKAESVKSEPSPTPSVPKAGDLPPVGGNQLPGGRTSQTPGANGKVPAGDAKLPDTKNTPAGTKPPVNKPTKPGTTGGNTGGTKPKPPVDPGTDPKPPVDPGTDPGTDPKPPVDPGTDPGTDPKPPVDPGTDPAPDPKPPVDPGTDPANPAQ